MKKQTIPRIINGPTDPPDPAVPKFWNIVEVNDEEAEITMYGEVVSQRPTDWWTGEPIEGLFITPEGFLEDLAQVKDKAKITVRINSVGGDLYTAIGICNRLKELNGDTVAVIDGIAASAATIIAMGCKEREIPEGALFMVHEALLTLIGNYNHKALLEVNKRLEAANKAAAEIYDGATHLGTDKIRNIMARETWYTGREAVENGFCTSIRAGCETSMCMSSVKDEIIVNGVRHSIKGFRNFPGNIPIINSVQTPTEPKPTAPSQGVSTNTKKEGGNTTMTPEELRAKYPEVVAQIEAAAREAASAEATAAERSRLKEIEAIEKTVGDAELIAAAKYGDNACTAQELAFNAMKKQAQLGEQHIQNAAADFKASNAAGVGSVPNSGAPAPKDQAPDENAQIAQLAAMIANGGTVPATPTETEKK
ncbi:MAG: Clp protease ClpP [Lachnospiraceae bacterium]|nr:Clp protease ClpP [Lachnospiraceae bacterium]